MLSSIVDLSEFLLHQSLAWCRNIGYNNGLLPVAKFDIPIIAIGNISTRGTGKTPLADYIFTLLQKQYKAATLSRGYGRASKMQADADGNTFSDGAFYVARKISDDPKDVRENSKFGIDATLERSPDTQVFILDEAFHHRNVQAGLKILITEYRIPFYKDDLLPFGRLREPVSGYKRADVIIVSECPEGLSTEEKEAIISCINPLPGQKVFFSYLEFGTPYDFYTGTKQPLSSLHNVVLLDAVQNHRLMAQYLIKNRVGSREQRFANGKYFTIDDLRILQILHHEWNLPILIREQESMRMLLYRKHLQNWNIPLYVLPITMRISGGSAPFDEVVTSYVKKSLGKTPAA